MRNHLLSRIGTLLLCLFSFSLLFAQQKTITGVVSDENGKPLSGATVTAKNARSATNTNDNGQFILTVPSNVTTLVISYVGMATQEVSIAGKSTVTLKLKPGTSTLDDVVVIGYGTARRANVTTSISSVSEKEIRNLPIAGADQAIQGKVAGVTVTNNGGQPGGGVSVRVRGITNATGSNEPLYVIDGVQMGAESNTLQQNALGGGSGSTTQSVLAMINPSDIASIDILKDASAQAIYGSRGANGVILITTKHGHAGEGKITYDTYFGWQQIPKKLDVMDLQQYATYLNSLVPEVRAAGGGMDSVGEFKNPALLGHGTDWQDEIYQTGMIQNHQLAFSGGQGKTNYYFSGNYYNQVGTLIETKFKRYNLRFNIDHQVKSWFKAGMSTNFSRSNQKIGLADGFDAVTSVVNYNSPATPVHDIYGNYISSVIIGGSSFGNPNNPVALARLRDVRSINSKAFGSIYGDLEFMKGLTLHNEFDYDFNLASNTAYQPFIQNDSTKTIIVSPSRIREERNNSLYWAVKNYLNYSGGFGKHWFYVTAGHEVQSSHYDYVQLTRDNLTLNLPSINAGQAGSSNGESTAAGAGDFRMESYFGRVNYTFDNRYALSGSIRADGSNTFGPGKRWGYFPAGSLSWTVTNEEFGKNIKHLDYLKLRLGVGSVGGQDANGPNLYTSNIVLYGQAPFGPGGLPRNVENPDLHWQSTITYNAGIDLTILNRKLDITVDGYKKISSGFILPNQLGNYSGLGTNYNDIQTPVTNDGRMTNTGYDITVTSYNISGKKLNWKTTATFSHYKNILNRLNNDQATIKGEVNEYGTIALVTLSQKNQPVGSFYGYVTDGLFRTEAEVKNGVNWGLLNFLDPAKNPATGTWLGDVRYKDLNGDKVIDDKDVTVIGNPNPKFTYGLTNTFNYGALDLSIFIYGSYGADIFNYSRLHTESLNSAYSNQLATVLDRFTPTNTNGSLPRYNQWHNNNLRISDRFIEDGSFLRIQNIAIGYNLPKNIINKARVSNARFYVSVQNAWTFTNYSGYDPELGAYNNSATFMNVDNGHYPNPRTYTVGANIEF
jgi:TonB-linked SusC/RagA family outer membrane protein